MKNDQRSRMKHATDNRLVYLHENFQLMDRMRDTCAMLVGVLRLSAGRATQIVINLRTRREADLQLMV